MKPIDLLLSIFDIKPNFWNFILHIPDVLKSAPNRIFLLNPEIFKSKVKMKK